MQTPASGSALNAAARKSASVFLNTPTLSPSEALRIEENDQGVPVMVASTMGRPHRKYPHLARNLLVTPLVRQLPTFTHKHMHLEEYRCFPRSPSLDSFTSDDSLATPTLNSPVTCTIRATPRVIHDSESKNSSCSDICLQTPTLSSPLISTSLLQAANMPAKHIQHCSRWPAGQVRKSSSTPELSICRMRSPPKTPFLKPAHYTKADHLHAPPFTPTFESPSLPSPPRYTRVLRSKNALDSSTGSVYAAQGTKSTRHYQGRCDVDGSPCTPWRTPPVPSPPKSTPLLVSGRMLYKCSNKENQQQDHLRHSPNTPSQKSPELPSPPRSTPFLRPTRHPQVGIAYSPPAPMQGYMISPIPLNFSDTTDMTGILAANSATMHWYPSLDCLTGSPLLPSTPSVEAQSPHTVCLQPQRADYLWKNKASTTTPNMT